MEEVIDFSSYDIFDKDMASNDKPSVPDERTDRYMFHRTDLEGRNKRYGIVRKEDAGSFFAMRNDFNTSFKFELISDADEIKKILEDKYSSKGRGEDYAVGLPSVTGITGDLFPIVPYKDKFLLKWMNDISIEDLNEQDLKNKEAQSKGTFLHKVLECFLLDNKRFKSKVLSDYIEQAIVSDEVKKKIPDINDKVDEYRKMATETLTDFVKKELKNIDCVYSEIFLKLPDRLQGCVDFVGYHNNTLSVFDWKSTSKVDKKTGKRKFGSLSTITSYVRQIYVYYYMLKELGYIPPHLEDNIKFRVYQFHVISNEYKAIDIPFENIMACEKDVKDVLDWYWKMKIRTDVF